MLTFEPYSLYAIGSRPGASFAVVKVSPVTTVLPTDGVTWKPVPGPSKCRYFVLTVSSIAIGGVSTAGQFVLFGTPWTASPGKVTSPKSACTSPKPNPVSAVSQMLSLYPTAVQFAG